MRPRLLFLLPLLVFSFLMQAQDSGGPMGRYRNFPLTVGIQFQNFALPLRDLKSNFTHVGFFVGTEFKLDNKANWVQQFQVGFYLNREIGNGIFVFTQSAFRPELTDDFYPELKLGIGWQRVFHPGPAYAFREGAWQTVRDGKSQLIVPLGISAGYDPRKTDTYAAPFVSYQLVPALFYNDVLPLNFYSLFQAGSRIHFN